MLVGYTLVARAHDKHTFDVVEALLSPRDMESTYAYLKNKKSAVSPRQLVAFSMDPVEYAGFRSVRLSMWVQGAQLVKGTDKVAYNTDMWINLCPQGLRNRKGGCIPKPVLTWRKLVRRDGTMLRFLQLSKEPVSCETRTKERSTVLKSFPREGHFFAELPGPYTAFQRAFAERWMEMMFADAEADRAECYAACGEIWKQYDRSKRDRAARVAAKREKILEETLPSPESFLPPKLRSCYDFVFPLLPDPASFESLYSPFVPEQEPGARGNIFADAYDTMWRHIAKVRRDRIGSQKPTLTEEQTEAVVTKRMRMFVDGLVDSATSIVESRLPRSQSRRIQTAQYSDV